MRIKRIILQLFTSDKKKTSEKSKKTPKVKLLSWWVNDKGKKNLASLYLDDGQNTVTWKEYLKSEIYTQNMFPLSGNLSYEAAQNKELKKIKF